MNNDDRFSNRAKKCRAWQFLVLRPLHTHTHTPNVNTNTVGSASDPSFGNAMNQQRIQQHNRFPLGSVNTIDIPFHSPSLPPSLVLFVVALFNFYNYSCQSLEAPWNKNDCSKSANEVHARGE